MSGDLVERLEGLAKHFDHCGDPRNADLLRSAASALRGEWRPMTDAPTDGTHVLIHRDGWGWPRSASFSAGSWWTNGERLKGSPDRWTPLPPPPGDAGR